MEMGWFKWCLRVWVSVDFLSYSSICLCVFVFDVLVCVRLDGDCVSSKKKCLRRSNRCVTLIYRCVEFSVGLIFSV